MLVQCGPLVAASTKCLVFESAVVFVMSLVFVHVNVQREEKLLPLL